MIAKIKCRLLPYFCSPHTSDTNKVGNQWCFSERHLAKDCSFATRMNERPANPGFDYETLKVPYAGYRTTDPAHRSPGYILRLEMRKQFLNVGAGAGSYEPAGPLVAAVEPSAAMRAQRIAFGKSPAIIGKAEALPFDDGAFEASMAMVTIHQWKDVAAGLREMRRVSRGPVVILTFDPERLADFWLADYFPELITAEAARFPTMAQLAEILGGTMEVKALAHPFRLQRRIHGSLLRQAGGILAGRGSPGAILLELFAGGIGRAARFKIR